MCPRGDQRNVCVFSPEWVLTIYDPCQDTWIVSSGWTYQMSAPVLGVDTIDFVDRILFEGGSFPWTTQLDLDAPDSLGTELCGTIQYIIEPVSYIESDANPLVTVDGTTLTLGPYSRVLTRRVYPPA